MAVYHVGCGAFAIYAGTLNKKGNMWVNKSEVTDEACDAVAEYLLNQEKEMHFTFRGKEYKLSVECIENDNAN